jgi:AraC-like DNA-binding protein
MIPAYRFKQMIAPRLYPVVKKRILQTNPEMEISIPEAASEKDKRSFSQHVLNCASEAAAIITSDLHHLYSIDKLAKKVCLNSKSLQVCFKHVYGKSIFVFGQEARLAHGKKLLRETDQSIQAIAEECGYPEQTNFGTAFKKKYGVSPGEWRKEA